MAWVVGIDIGGGGARLQAIPEAGAAAAVELALDAPLQIGPDGSNATTLVEDIAAQFAADARCAGPVAAVAVGASGILGLVADRESMHDALAAGFRASLTGVASDAVTAHLGALGGEPGAVVAAGTGLVALGTDFDTTWRRVDGWGHILGDEGGGAWIGRRGLHAGLAALDGRPHGSARLLQLGSERFGDPDAWPARIQTRPDRAHLLASMTPLVAQAAREGDPEARRILTKAAHHIADAAAAALVDPAVPPLASVTGGVLSIDPPLSPLIAARLAKIHVELRQAAAGPCEGAVLLAARLASGTWHADVSPWVTWRRHDTAGAAG